MLQGRLSGESVTQDKYMVKGMDMCMAMLDFKVPDPRPQSLFAGLSHEIHFLRLLAGLAFHI